MENQNKPLNINSHYDIDPVTAPVKKTEINDREGSAALTTRPLLSTKVDTKFRRQVAVAQSV
jgi:hypothetical protein